MGALSKPKLTSRIAAWVLDAILVSMIAVGGAIWLPSLFGVDAYNATYNAAYQKYEAQYGISFLTSTEEYQEMAEAERESYDAAYQKAYEALVQDQEAMHAFNMIVQLFVLGISLGILLAVLIVEFVIPLLLKNGQTVGKKAFSIGVVRADGVKASTLQLLIRALLGKYTIETMVPIFMLLMICLGMIGIVGLIVIAGFFLLQLVVYVSSKNNSLLHDLMSGTVVVDLNTQRVFASTDDLLAHIKRIHADRAAKQDY